jgi:hypothetical protein
MNAVTQNENTALTVPEAAHAVQVANEAFEIAQAYTIDSPDMYQAAGEELRAIATKAKKLEETRLSLTRPLDESKKRIMDLFRGPLERLQAAEGVLRGSMLTWKREEDRKAEEARRKAEAEAQAERERLAREQAEAEERARELANQAAVVDDPEERARLELEAFEASETAATAAEQAAIAEVAPPVQAVVPTTTKAAGISSRQTWKAEVVDKAALIRAAANDHSLMVYLLVDEKAVGAIARALKAETRIPGVRVYAEDGLAVRRA